MSEDAEEADEEGEEEDLGRPEVLPKRRRSRQDQLLPLVTAISEMAKAVSASAPATDVDRVFAGVQGAGTLQGARGILGLEALKREMLEYPLEFLSRVRANRGKTVGSWRRWLRDEMALEGHRVIMLICWALMHALDDFDKADASSSKETRAHRTALGKARCYALVQAMDQCIIDGGDWRRAYPLLHIEDPPASCRRKDPPALTPNPVSRLVEPKAAAILAAWQRDIRILRPGSGEQEDDGNYQEDKRSSRAKARAKARDNKQATAAKEKAKASPKKKTGG